MKACPGPRSCRVLKLLPKTNCRECGEPTCMVFAVSVTEGIKGVEDCPPLSQENKNKLELYLSPFKLDL